MNFTPIGDLARMLQFRQDQGRLRQNLTEASTEMSTGRRRDLGVAVNGDMSMLAGIERSARLSDSYLRAAGIGAAQAAAVQAGLGTINAFTTGYGAELAGVAAQAAPLAMAAESAVAQRNLETTIGALNIRLGDIYLLSGQRADTRPLPQASTLLSELRDIIAGQTTTSAVVQAVDDWFAAPQGSGGFLDLYKGDSGPGPSHQITETEIISLGLNATNDAFRSVLSGLALASLANDPGLESTVQAAGLIEAASERLVGAADGIADLRGRLGSVEAEIEAGASRSRAAAAAVTLLQASMIGVDPADAASEVLAIEGQLETLYMLTARLQQMKLVNYL